MPSFDIVKDIKPESSYRVSAIVSNFDLDLDHLEERFAGEINPPEGWQIGLIVGGGAERAKRRLQKSVSRRRISPDMSIRISPL